MKSTRRILLSRATFSGFLLSLLPLATSHAEPKGGQVVSGSGSIRQDGDVTTIRASNGAIINYSGFNIGKGETVNFIQPGSSARVLNRVNSADPTHIFGSLNAKGSVYLLNPNGVYFQNGSMVNVGNLYAAAGHLSDTDFRSGKNNFTNLTSDVVNAGSILGQNGVHLFGEHVANFGSLVAEKGVVMMAAGTDVLVGQRDSHIFIRANKTTTAAAAGAAPNQIPGVQNAGTIRAPKAIMGAGDMYAVAINNTGLIKSPNIAINGGKAGQVNISGTLDASATAPRAKGGKITVTGHEVALKSATLDASGPRGGGTVLIGGGFGGKGSVAPAQKTSIDATSSIKADATVQGAGGQVAIWSEKATNFRGTISAQGARVDPTVTKGVGGGVAEVSSKGALGFTGTTNLIGGDGSLGKLLLDPRNIIVQSGDGPFTPIGLDKIIEYGDFPNDTLTVSPTALGIALLNSTVTLQAIDDIAFLSDVDGGNNGNLVLEAGRSIFFGLAGPVTLTIRGSLRATAAAGNVTGGTPSAGDSLIFMAPGSTINTSLRDGAITLNNSRGNLILANLNAGSGDVTLNTNGTAVQTGNITSGGLLLRGSNTSNFSLTSTGNKVTRIAGDAGGVILLQDSSEELTVGTINGIAGLTNTTGANITLNTTGILNVAQRVANNGQNTSSSIDLTSGSAISITAGLDANRGSVRLISQGAIAQTGTGIITAASLGVRNNGTAGDINLSTAANLPSGGTVALFNNAAGGKINFRGGGAVTVGSVTGPAAFGTVTGVATTANAGANSISLSAAGNLTLGENVTATGSTVNLLSGSALAVNSTIAADALSLQAVTAGTIGGANVGTLAAKLTGQGAAFNFATNGPLIIGSVGTLSGITTVDGSIGVQSQSTLSILNEINAGTGTVRLGSQGNLTQSNGGKITAAALSAVNSGGIGDIALASAPNVVGTVAFNNAAGNGAVSYFGQGGYTVGNVAAGGILGAVNGITTTLGIIPTNVISLTSSGAITLQSNLSAAGSTILLNAGGGIVQDAGNLSAGSLAVVAGGDVTLGRNNFISNLAVDMTVAGADFSLVRQSGDLNVNSVAGVDGITTEGGNVSLVINDGSLLLERAIDVGGGQLSLRTTGATRTITNTTTLKADRLVLQSTDALGFTSGQSINTLSAAVTNDFYFTNDGSLTVGTLAGLPGISSGGNDISLQAGGALTINGLLNAGAGTVRLISDGNLIETASGGIVAGDLGVRNQAAAAGSNIDLSFNNVIGVLGNVGVFAAVNTSAGGTIFFTNSATAQGLEIGVISPFESAPAEFTFGTTVGVESSGGDVKLVSGGRLVLNQNVVAEGANVLLSGGLQVQQNNGLVLSKGLAIRSAIAPVLPTGSTFDTLAVEITRAGESFSYASSGPLTISSILGVSGIITNNAAITVGTNTGDLTISGRVDSGIGITKLFAKTGAIKETETGVVKALALSVDAANTSELAGQNEVGTLAARITNADQSFTFVNKGTLNIGQVSGIEGATITGISTFGAINAVNIKSGGNLNINQAVNSGFGTVRLISNGTITQDEVGAISGRTLGVRNEGATGNISLKLGTGTEFVAVYNAAAGGSILLDSRNPDGVTIGSVSAVDENNFDFALTQGLVASGDATVGVKSVSSITIANVIDNAGGEVLLSGNGVISESLGGSIKARELGIRNGNNPGGLIALTSALNQIGTVAALSQSAGGFININNAGAELEVGAVSTASGFDFADVNGVQSTGGKVTLTTIGALAVNDVVRSGGGDIKLQSTGQIRTAGNVNSSGGNIGLISGTDLVLTRDVVAGDGTIYLSSNGGLRQDSGSINGAALAVRNAGDGAVLLGRGNAIGTLAIRNDAPGQEIRFLGDNPAQLVIGSVIANADLGFAGDISGITTTTGLTPGTNTVRLTNGGNILMVNDITAPGADVILTSTAGTLLQTTGRIVADGLALRVTNSPSFGLTGNSFSRLAAEVTAPGGNFVYRQIADLTIGTVDGINGIKTVDGLISLATNGQLSLVSNLTAGTGDIILQGERVIQGADSVITGGGLALGTVFTPSLNENNQVARLAANITGAGQGFTYTQNAAFSVGLVGAFSGIRANGEVVLSSLTSNIDLGANVTALGSNVRLKTLQGAITSSGGGVFADHLFVQSRNEAVLRGPNLVLRLSLVNTASGNVCFNNSGDLSLIGDGGDFAGVVNAGAGTLTVRSAGTLTVEDLVSSGGDVDLSTATPIANLLVRADVTSTAGDVKLDAGGNLLQSGGNIVSTNEVSLKAGNVIRQGDAGGKGIIRADALITESGGNTNLQMQNRVDTYEAISEQGNIIFNNAKNSLEVVGASAEDGFVQISSAGSLLTSGPIIADGTFRLLAQGNQTINGDLTSTGGGAITLAPTGAASNVLVRGLVNTGGAFTVAPLGNAFLSGAVNAGSITVTGQNVGIGNATASGDLSLDAVEDLFLNGTVYSASNVLLNADPDSPRTANPQASIILSNPALTTITADGIFAVGYLENLLSSGSLTINAGTAMLGDTAARGALLVNAGEVILMDREPNGGSSAGRQDRGLNFVGNTIDFNGASVSFSGQGNGRAFFSVASGTANVERIAGTTFYVDSELDTQFGTPLTNVDGVFPSFTTFPLQPITGGSVDANVVAALAGALPELKAPPGTTEARLSAATVAKLLSLGVSARDPDEDERKAIKARRALFKQLIAKTTATDSDYQVVVNRIAPGQVELVLNTYDRIFGAKQELKPKIEQLFTEEYAKYIEKTAAEDASGFGAYLMLNQAKDPQAKNALAVVGQFRELFTQLGKIGLTNKEVEISQDVVARSLQIEGITPADFLALVGTPKRQAPPAAPAPVAPSAPAPAAPQASVVLPAQAPS